jgi:hypothetical protein
VRVVSYALWGDNPLYWNGFEALVKGHHAVWPGWEMRIHYDDSIAGNPYQLLAYHLDVEGLIRLVHAGERCGERMARGMLWRMKPIWSEQVEVCVCRDADAVPVIADRWAVEEFIESVATVHGINDAQAHSIPLMGGMVGFKCRHFRPMLDALDWHQFAAKCKRPNEHGGDQDLLMEYVWPKVRNQSLVHRMNSNLNYANAIMRGEPKPREINGVSWAVTETPSRSIMPHLGAAGYDVANAVKFYSKHGNQEVNATYDRIAKDLLRR